MLVFRAFSYLIYFFGYNIIGDFMKKINEIIRDFREDNDLSQAEVANYLKVPRSTYGRYENGNSKIPIDIFIQLCNFYKTTPNLILGFSSNSQNLDASKFHKLYNFIIDENIDIEELINFIISSKNIWK